MYSGHWDNDRHVFFAEEAGLDPSSVPSRLHVHVSNFLAKREVENEDSEIPINFIVEVASEPADYRKRLESFSILSEPKLIRQKFFHGDEPLKSLEIDCVVDWRREGIQFRGLAKGSECSSLYPTPKGSKKLTQTWTLSNEEMWIVSRRGARTIESRLRRVRPFECWVSILRGASHGDSGIDQNDWDFRRGIKLHDQGGEAALLTDEFPPRKIRLVLRDVEWPFGRNRPSLVLYVMDGNNDRAVSYAWGESKADRIGINLRWIQASCTHTPSDED